MSTHLARSLACVVATALAACESGPAPEADAPVDASTAREDDTIEPEAEPATARTPAATCEHYCGEATGCLHGMCEGEWEDDLAACLAACDPGAVPPLTSCYALQTGWCAADPSLGAWCACPNGETLCGRVEALDVVWAGCAADAATDGTCGIARLVLRGDGTYTLEHADPVAGCASGAWAADCVARSSSWDAGSLVLTPALGDAHTLALEVQYDAVGYATSLRLDDHWLAPTPWADGGFVAWGCDLP